MKFGRLRARFKGSVQAEWNDNINLSETNPESDISIGPYVGVGFIWQVNRTQVMEFNLEGGYRWYLERSDLSSFDIRPTSRLSHSFLIGDVSFVVWDGFSVSVDPTTQGEISGGVGLLNFRRFHNDLGLVASYQPFEDVTVSGNYTWGLDRAISRQFTSLDKDTHTFGAGVYYKPTVRWTVGLNGSVSYTIYKSNAQNNGVGYSLGAIAYYRPTRNLYFQGSAGVYLGRFETSGLLADTSSANSFVYQLVATHTVNKRINQNISLRKIISPGVGSNFSDILSLQYGLNWVMSKQMALNARLGYEDLESSGPGGDDSFRYLATIGTGLQLTRDWSAGISYSFALKDSVQVNRDYIQNRFLIELNHQF